MQCLFDNRIKVGTILLVAWLVGVGCGENERMTTARINDSGSSDDASETEDANAPIETDTDSARSLNAIGGACQDDTACISGRCATSFRQFRTTVPAPGGYCTLNCGIDSDCEPGAVCVGARFNTGGHCSSICQTNDDCRAGYRCFAPDALTGSVTSGADIESAATTCQPAPDTDQLEDGEVGSACATDADCGSGRCMLAEDIMGTPFADGYCTGSCVEDSDCGAMGRCVPGFLGAIGICGLRCESDADCERDGYRCRISGNIGGCAPGPIPLPDNVVGNACESDADCGGGPNSCASSLYSVEAPAGYCSQACSLDADCGEGGVCINGISVAALPTGTCYRSCVDQEDCREGYRCNSFTGESGEGVCVPLRPNENAES